MVIPTSSSGLVFIIIFLVFLAASAIKILKEYERGVICPVPVDLIKGFLEKK